MTILWFQDISHPGEKSTNAGMSPIPAGWK